MILSWMSKKWGGMMNKTCVYYCEGEDEQKLFAERNSELVKRG